MLLIHLVVKSFLAALRVSRLPSIGAALTRGALCRTAMGQHARAPAINGNVEIGTEGLALAWWVRAQGPLSTTRCPITWIWSHGSERGSLGECFTLPVRAI